MTKIVSATFTTNEAAEYALRALESHGFTEEQISVVLTDRSRGNTFNIDNASKVPEGAAFGGLAGGLLGALVAGLTAVGAVATAGVGVLVAGPVVAALAGGGAGAAAGGLIGSLIGLGIPEHEAKIYHDEVVKDGAVLIAVEAENGDRADEVKGIFESMDAHHLAA